MKIITHMSQFGNVFRKGWTKCGSHKLVKRTDKWKYVTCKSCLKLKKKEQEKMNYLKTKKCKRCNKTGKVKLITITKKWNGYVCDNCNWYFSINKGDKQR